ncbi:unnamed protein product [Arctogadus glacialis]
MLCSCYRRRLSRLRTSWPRHQRARPRPPPQLGFRCHISSEPFAFLSSKTTRDSRYTIGDTRPHRDGFSQEPISGLPQEVRNHTVMTVVRDQPTAFRGGPVGGDTAFFGV